MTAIADIFMKEKLIFPYHRLSTAAEEHGSRAGNYNLYFVLRGPLIRIQKIKKVSSSHFACYLGIQNGEKAQQACRQFLFPPHRIPRKAEIIQQSMALRFVFEDETTVTFDAARILTYERFENLPFFRYEPLYIGSSNRKSDSNIFNRLLQHKTLQTISREHFLDDSSTSDLYIMIAGVHVKLIETLDLDPFINITCANTLNDKDLSEQGLKDKAILIAEAMLITLFKPLYNTHYINSSNQVAFQAFMDLGLEKAAFSLDTSFPNEVVFFATPAFETKTKATLVHCTRADSGGFTVSATIEPDFFVD